MMLSVPEPEVGAGLSSPRLGPRGEAEGSPQTRRELSCLSETGAETSHGGPGLAWGEPGRLPCCPRNPAACPLPVPRDAQGGEQRARAERVQRVRGEYPTQLKDTQSQNFKKENQAALFFSVSLVSAPWLPPLCTATGCPAHFLCSLSVSPLQLQGSRGAFNSGCGNTRKVL